MINVKPIIFSGNKDSLANIKKDDKQVFWLNDMQTDSKSMVEYSNITGEIIERDIFNEEYFFFCDRINKEIYLYQIVQQTLFIKNFDGSSLLLVCNTNFTNEECIEEVNAFGGYIFVKIYCGDFGRRCRMYSREHKVWYKVNDFAFVNTVGMIEVIKKQGRNYLIFEESYFMNYEIPDLRMKDGSVEFEKLNNKVLLVDFDEFIFAIKKNNDIKYSVLLSSQGNQYISFLGISEGKIICFKKAENDNIIVSIFLEDYTRIEKSISRVITEISVTDNVNYISYDNGKYYIYNSDRNLIFEKSDSFDFEDVGLALVSDDQYAIFYGYEYHDNNNNEKQKVYSIIDMKTNEQQMYKCNNIVINDCVI